jgi:hypothetical protein
MAKKSKLLDLSDEERREHAVAQEQHAYQCGKNFKRDGLEYKFHDPVLQAIYEAAKYVP